VNYDQPAWGRVAYWAVLVLIAAVLVVGITLDAH